MFIATVLKILRIRSLFISLPFPHSIVRSSCPFTQHEICPIRDPPLHQEEGGLLPISRKSQAPPSAVPILLLQRTNSIPRKPSPNRSPRVPCSCASICFDLLDRSSLLLFLLLHYTLSIFTPELILCCRYCHLLTTFVQVCNLPYP